MKLTVQQEKVVSASISNLLISAAAGSGKTSVMTERITQRVLSGDLELDRILVMTFTEAASTNMREKIENALQKVLQSESLSADDRQRVNRQLSLLPSSHISTIHSFCLSVIENFAFEVSGNAEYIQIEPGFSTLDDSEAKIIFSDAVEEVLTAFYELFAKRFENKDMLVFDENIADQIEPFSLLEENIDEKDWLVSFQNMAEVFGQIRSDNSLREMIQRFHSYLRSLPDYEKWIAQVLSDFKETSINFAASRSADMLLQSFYEALSLAEPIISLLEIEVSGVPFVKDEKKNQEYTEKISARIQIVKALSEMKKHNTLTWEACTDIAEQIPEHRTISVRETDPEEKKNFLEQYQVINEVLYYFTGKASGKDKDMFRTEPICLFSRSFASIESELQEMLPLISRFFETLICVDRRYQAKKEQRNAVDFSDYEHMSLALLSDPQVQEYYANMFQEIYIDEYQDNSPIQEAIISKFARENCFMVGDVKQSIYRFRHARPQFFMEKMYAYRENIGGILLELNMNFRSRPNVISTVNFLFEQLLSESAGEIEYDQTQRLFASKEAITGEHAKTELILIDVTKTQDKQDVAVDQTHENVVHEDINIDDVNGSTLEDQEDLDKVQKEALVVASRIRQLLTLPDVKPEDIAVLCRTNGLLQLYQDILLSRGIPTEGGVQKNFFQKREILLMDNMIRLLDNFCQDITLAAIMRGPFAQCGFTSEELTEIRLLPDLIIEECKQALGAEKSANSDIGKKYKNEPFHQKVLRYPDDGNQPILQQRVRQFLDWIDDLRNQAVFLRLSVLIEEIYTQTDLRNYVSHFSDGKQRLRDLDVFRDWAHRYDASQNRGLYRFVRYVQEMREKEAVLQEKDSFSGDKVRCITIHKSKGLEFPYVFLVGMDKSIRSKNTSMPILLSQYFGIGSNYMNTEKAYTRSTFPKEAIVNEERRANLAEELRLFYVALTRAEDKLFLVSTFKRTTGGEMQGSAKLLRFAGELIGKQLPAWLVWKAKSYLDFCLLAFCRHNSFPFAELAEPDAIRKVSWNEKDADIPELSVVFADYGSELKEVILNDAVIDAPETSQSEDVILSDEECTLLEKQMADPYENVLQIPAKMTVSQLKRRVNDGGRAEEDEDAVSLPEDEEQAFVVRPINLIVQKTGKDDLNSSDLSPAQRGTLLHSLFRYIDFSRLRDAANEQILENLLTELSEYRMISSRYFSEIRPYFSAILGFAKSEICMRMLAAEQKPDCGPFREIPFSLAQLVQGEKTLVQGMIDCWFIEDGEAVLLDYKSDRISGSKEEKQKVLVDRYQVQLDYYTRAIEAAGKLTVKEKHIWLIPDVVDFLI